MKQPDDRNTTNRDEMMCPRCDREGLEENPAYSDEYTGMSELIKATRCSNPDCDYHYGLPENEVKRQMPESSSLNSLKNIFSFELNAASIIRVFVIFGGLIFLLSQIGLIPFIGEDTTETDIVQSNITGNLDDENITTLNVELRNSEGDMIEELEENNNEFNFENIDEGIYSIYVSSSQLDFAPPGKQIELGNEDKNFNFETQEIEPFDINQTVDNSNIILDYKNPNNIDDLEFTISPIEGDNIEREHEISSDMDETILMPVSPESEQIRVDAPITKEEQIINNQYTQQPETYDIIGNMAAEELLITLTEESSSDVQSETFEIPQDDVRESIFVSGDETLGDVNITIRNGTSQASEQETGTWDGQNNITFFTGVDEFTTANMQIEPVTVKDDQELTGEIFDSIIEHNFEGNMPIEDARIMFDGGDIDSTVVGSIDESESAENGTIRKEYLLSEIEETSRYRIDWDASIIDNPDLVNFSYKINGDENSIEEGEDGTAMDLEAGDEVSIVMEVERDTVSPDEDVPHFGSLDDNLKINDVSFSDNNPNIGDSIEKYATIENTASNDITEEIVFYLNGDKATSREYTFSANSEKQIGGVNELGSTAVSEEGTNVWYINDIGPYFLEVGDSESVYGEGEINSELRDIGSDGEVSVDTNSDGTNDCTVSSTNGECSLDTLEPGNNQINVSQRNINGTNYIIEYTESNNPRDINVDIGEDNITDFEYDGILTRTQSQNVEISPENTTMNISSENNIPVDYSISWDAESVIDNPVIYHEGDPVVRDKGSFQKPETVQIGSLPEGENEFRFRSSSGGYTVDIEWVEDEGQSYPHTLINNQNVCGQGSEFATNQTCTSSEGISPGEHTLEFDRVSGSFDYQIRYDARAVTGHVEVNINDDSQRFSRDTAAAEPWNDVSSTSLLQRGENNVSIESEEINGISTKSTATIQYSLDTGVVENPEIIVVNGENETNTAEIPSDSIDNSGQLISDADITIPKEWLTIGENTIEITTEDGIFEIEGEIYLHDENIVFETD